MRKLKTCALATFLFLTGQQVYAQTTLDDLRNPPVVRKQPAVTTLRTEMLMEAGKTVGFRGGMVARAEEIKLALNSHSQELDRIFQFSTLVSVDGMLPPVIVEARDIASFAPDQIRFANRAYSIEREERFISVPPTWREYLFIGLPIGQMVDFPEMEARPQNSEERGVWQRAVNIGWQQGIEQADAILFENFNRLVRDYTGMLRYSILLQQQMVSNTRVTESLQVVTGHSREMIIGDRHRRVTSHAGFIVNPAHWKPIVVIEPEQAKLDYCDSVFLKRIINIKIIECNDNK